MFFGNDKIQSLVEIAQGVPGRVTIADIDADGYPDIILTGKITRDQKDITQTAIFMNSQANSQSPQVNSDGTTTVSKSNNGLTKDSRREFNEQTSDYKI